MNAWTSWATHQWPYERSFYLHHRLQILEAKENLILNPAALTKQINQVFMPEEPDGT